MAGEEWRSGAAELVGLAASAGTRNGPGAAHGAPHAFSPFTDRPPKGYAIVPNAPALNIDAANRATIVHRADGDTTGYATREGVALCNTIAGCAQLITDGADTTPDLAWHTNPKNLKARSAAGLSKDNRWLTLLAVDAAGPSQGMTEKEVARFMLDEPAELWPPPRRIHNAIALDGGGSTTLALVDPKTGTARVVNTPAGAPCAVGSNLAVLLVERQ